LGDVGEIGEEALAQPCSGIEGGEVSHGDGRRSLCDLGLMAGWKPALPVVAKF
jgi:hypothetical protein